MSVDRSQHGIARPRRAVARLAVQAVRCLAVAACLALLAGVQSAGAAGYRLGPEDQVRVKVFEWRPSRDTIFPWTALNDTFTVGPDGWLSLPLAGRVRAGGLTTGEVEQAIGAGLQKNMGLTRRPDTAVEVVTFRPFYVAGSVTRAGAYPYRPGLTVLQAVAIAGGLPTPQNDFARFQREIIQGEGDLSLLQSSRVDLLARMSRLQSELNGAKSIQFSDLLMAHRDDPLVKTAMQQETLVFNARKDGLDTQINALNSLAAFLDKETTALQEQLGFLDKQIASIRHELGNVSSLVKKGLAAAPREFELERSLAQAQSDRLGAETSLLRAKQEESRTSLSVIELQDGRRNEVTQGIRQTQSDLEDNTRKQATSRLLVQDSAVTAPRLLARRQELETAEPVYTIMRPQPGGRTAEIAAQEATPVEPGDTVKVELPLPADDGLGLSPATGTTSAVDPAAPPRSILASGTAAIQ